MATTVEPRYTGIMAEMNESGDMKVMWDKDNEEEVEAARATFDRLVNEKGFAAFVVEGRRGTKGERLREFDPEAERIILVPPIQGG